LQTPDVFDNSDAESLCRQAVRLREQGDTHGAFVALQHAIALEPDFAEARFYLGCLHLLEGNYRPGFAEFEWRWRWSGFATPHLEVAQPAWDGADLRGRTILLHGEQGLGDSLQFCRYAPLLAERAGRVLLQVPAALVAVLRTLDGVETVVAPGEQLPPFDVHAPLMSLPHLVGTTVETIPARVPYLHADPSAMARWRERLRGPSDGMRVGLVWSGNPAHPRQHVRSLPLACLEPLATVPGVTFYSLQKGPAAEEGHASNLGLPLTDLGPLLEDFAETAAALSQLDLLITVDTSVAHMAGALGRPVWLLLAAVADWRWLLDRADSPWYPTLRLFRQHRLGDWQSVVEAVRRAMVGCPGAPS
jgi:hypothetical protein